MSSDTHRGQQPEELRIVSKRYIGRWISALIVMLALFAIANSMLHNPRFEWAIIAENFTGPSILQGVLMTLQLTAISVICGFAGGTVLALMRLSSNPVLVAVSWGYTGFPRRTDAGSAVPLVQHRCAVSHHLALAAVGRGNLERVGQFAHQPV